MSMRHAHTNRLSREKSPYLLQHAHNPVDWYPWSQDAFTKAKKENKPILLSIGYSTCHWCHVMEHESFEDVEIAGLMNQYFVSIKVDREERSDLDHLYMTAVSALTGQGGWPLTVFLTPDKKPFYGGTYFPPEPRFGSPGFKQVLTSLHDAWQNRQPEILASSESLIESLKESSQPRADAISLNERVLRTAYCQFVRSFDSRYGGFGSAPKFPSSHNLSFLLHYKKRFGAADALSMVETTLQEMRKGGMYDQLGGGFHRYSTDERWQVPHFEKMLYDQAILARTYLEAYQMTGQEQYANVAREIFDYVLRDMQQKEGGFYSAEDADSLETNHEPRITSHEASLVKKEGAFYLWDFKEIQKVLGEEDSAIFNYYFGVEEHGNAFYDPHGEFTGKNILYQAHSLKQTAEHFNKPFQDAEESIAASKEKLFVLRGERPRPQRDDKVLTDWNGLLISSLAFGSRVLDEPRYRQAAVKAAEFILQHLVRGDGRLLHRYCAGEAAIGGTITDYAFFIHGLLGLYEATFEVRYLKEAIKFTEEMIRFFGDPVFGGFFIAAEDTPGLFMRQKEIYDGALPSGNSVAALDLLRLSAISLNNDWNKKAEKIFSHFGREIGERPSAFTQMLVALDFFLGPSREIVISAEKDGPQMDEFLKIFYRTFVPNRVLLVRLASLPDKEELFSVAGFVKEQIPLQGKTTAYVCQNHVCQLPTADSNIFEKLLSSPSSHDSIVPDLGTPGPGAADGLTNAHG